jgi:hypothetical protein
MFPPWMHLRDNPRSVGQQLISAPAVILKRLENELNDSMRSQFLSTAKLDEVDVLYRVKLTSDVNLTNASASGIRCVAAPSGCSPSGISQIWVKEITDLEEFYYNVLPTRIEVISSGDYAATVDDRYWNIKPSGIIDLDENHVDVWGTTHEISWCSGDGRIRKQDTETLEDYEEYSRPGPGSIVDMDFYEGMLWAVNASGSRYYLTLDSTKTKNPSNSTLETLGIYDITDGFDLQPSGILIRDDGMISICDTGKTRIYDVRPRYDYFILDKDNRYLYFREDYRNSGVFISNN